MKLQRRYPWLLCWLLFGATALSFLDRQVLSVLAPALSTDFHMNNTAYSRVVFAFQVSYTIMFLLGGWMMDRLGTRTGMAVSVGVWSLASGAHALVTGPLGLGAARFVLGFGEGGCFPGAMKGAVEWFPLEKRVLAIGIANGGSAFGAVVAPPLTALVAARFGWRGAFLATAALGLLWLAMWLMTSHVPSHDISAELSRREASISIRTLLADGTVRRVLAARFLFDPVFYFYMFWIPQYLARERGFSLSQIGSYFWIPFLVLGLSTILSGRLSDALVRGGRAPLRSRVVLLTLAALATPVSWLASLAPNPVSVIVLMSVLMAAHGLWITNFLGLLSDLFPSRVIATITGMTGTAGGIGGMVSSLIVGPVVDRFSFGPAFAVSGVLYPAALMLLLAAVRREKLVQESAREGKERV